MFFYGSRCGQARKGKTRLSGALVLAVVLLASGCAQNSTGPVPDSATRAVAVPTAQPGLSTQQRLRRALSLLEDGDEATARVELVAYMRDSSNSAIGRSLLRQIDTPPDEYFPAEYREVILRKGQSLSNIAKDYLGSAVQFHALAKYNAIDRPRRMFPGQIVKVPLTGAARTAFADLDDALDEPAADSLPLAETFVSESAESINTGDTPPPSSQNTELAGSAASIPSPTEATEVTAIPSTDSAAEKAVSAAQTSEETLDGAAVSEALDSAEETVTAQELQAVAAMPVAEEPAAQIDVDLLHRRAINAYRAQDLDTAISLWDQILEADPSYEGARLYRSQALALKKRLNSLN
jgi:tetratricopeptide (TPR) repeat protein